MKLRAQIVNLRLAQPSRMRIGTIGIDRAQAMANPSVKEKLAAQGATLIGDSPEHFRSFIADETAKWAKVIKDAGVETNK